MTVFVRYQEDGSVTIRTPYSEAFKDDLKASIPFRHRTWQPEEKLWWVDWHFAKDAEALCKDWFEDVKVILYRRDDEPPRSGAGNGAGLGKPVEPWASLNLLPTAPPEQVESSYRTLMKLNHPDAGGDTLTAQKINAAYAALKGKR